ncbi:MAG: MmcQ/YjbR family DNA-binding protein [Firmicutes bacterium]|nr:MmcQ/YjbR family DNA-binding protein [Bacillota bacterium]
MTRDTLFQYAFDTYSVEPDYPWMETPEAGVLRHPDTRKWFGLVMRVPARCIGHPSEDLIDILNVKADPMFISVVVGHDGFYRAYHMNKEHWMTIALAEASDEAIRMALDQSYEMTERKRK